MATRYYVAIHPETGSVFTRSSDNREYAFAVVVWDGLRSRWLASGWRRTKELAVALMQDASRRGERKADALIAHAVDRKTYFLAKEAEESGLAFSLPSPTPEPPEALEEAFPADPEPSRAALLFGAAPLEPQEAPEEAPKARGGHTTRESWLLAFVDASRPQFEAAGAPLPEAIRVAIGMPSAGARSNVIGECWTFAASADGAVEIFIRPSLQSDASRVADVLTHELIHAALGIEEGHGHGFRRVMKALGLSGKATATVAGPEWHTWADPILADLGPLPGAALMDSAVKGGKKKQTTRYLKVVCTDCEWQARVTAKHLEGRELRCPDAHCEGLLKKDGSDE